MRSATQNGAVTIRSILVAALSCVFLAGNLSAAEQFTPVDPAHRAKSSVSLHLHSAPNLYGSSQALRESFPEEVQRIEGLRGRQKFTRHDHLHDVLGNDPLMPLSSKSPVQPLLLLQSACSQANLIAFAHAYLAARYPIPPPTAAS